MTLQQWLHHGINRECLWHHSSAVKAALTLLALDSRKYQFCDRGFRCVHRLQYSKDFLIAKKITLHMTKSRFPCPARGLQCSKGLCLYELEAECWSLKTWITIFKVIKNVKGNMGKTKKARTWYFIQIHLWSIDSTWSKQLWMRFQL